VCTVSTFQYSIALSESFTIVRMFIDASRPKCHVWLAPVLAAQRLLKRRHTQHKHRFRCSIVKDKDWQ